MGWLTENWESIVAIGTAVVTIASVIAKLTPTKWDDNVISKVVDFLALTKKK